MSNYQIPLDGNGNMVQYQYDIKVDKMVDNFEWIDLLCYEGYGRGRSAAYFMFRSQTTEKRYYVFMTDFDKMIPLMMNGFVQAKFTFVKRGRNYGIKMVRK